MTATPSANGHAKLVQRLAALHLPPLAGKRFLEIGCGEGSACGFAAHLGAQAVVGLDDDLASVAQARLRFGHCEFHSLDEDRLPEGRFDVILLSPLLHRHAEPQRLIALALARLAPDGLLVLDAAVASSKASEFISHARAGAPEGHFASMPLMREWLAPYAYKHLGSSGSLAGYPVATHVFHIRARRPFAYLLMQPPAFGKSTIGRCLFTPAGVPLVSGDQLLLDIAEGRTQVPAPLLAAIQPGFSASAIHRLVEKLAEGPALELLLSTVEHLAGGRDFAFDLYLPAPAHRRVLDYFEKHGYLPVALHWRAVSNSLTSLEDASSRAQKFIASLPASALPPQPVALPFRGSTGHVDSLMLSGRDVVIKGWALSDTGLRPALMQVRLGGQQWLFEKFSTSLRPDVQKHFGLSHAECGYKLRVPLGDCSSLAAFAEALQLHAGPTASQLDGPFTLSSELQRLAGTPAASKP